MVKRARGTELLARSARWKSAYGAGPPAFALAWIAGASACQLIGGIEEKVLVPAGGGGGGESNTTSATAAGGAAGEGGASVVDPSCSGKTAEGATRAAATTYGEFVASPGADTVADIAFDSPRIVFAGANSGEIYIKRSSTDGIPAFNWDLPLVKGNAMVATVGGKIFAGGRFTDPMTIPGCPPLSLNPTGASALFVAELGDTTENQCVWATAIQSSGDPRARAIAADAEGAAYLTGELAGTITSPPGDCTGATLNGENMFLAKFTPMGTCAWVHSGGPAGSDAQLIATVAVRSGRDGFVVAGGAYVASEQDIVVFTGATPFLQQGGTNAFLVSYDLAGNYRWRRSFGSEFEEQISGVAIDAQGNVIAAGHYQGTFDANADVKVEEPVPRCDLPETASQGALVMKLDADGQILWARGFGQQAFADGVAVDTNGAVFVTGSFRNFIDFGAGQIGAPVDFWHIFILKLDRDGHHVWSTTLPNRDPGTGGDFANAAAVSGGTLLVGGHFQGTVAFGGAIGTQASAGADGFLIGLHP